MAGINWKRVLVGGIVSASVWGILYAPLHPIVEAHDALGRPALPLTPFRGASRLMRELIVLSGFVQGFAITWLYAAIRPRFGPGPKTALIAGIGIWFLVSWMHLVWTVFTAASPSMAIAPIATNLPIVVLSAIAGAWVYKE